MNLVIETFLENQLKVHKRWEARIEQMRSCPVLAYLDSLCRQTPSNEYRVRCSTKRGIVFAEFTFTGSRNAILEIAKEVGEIGVLQADPRSHLPLLHWSVIRERGDPRLLSLDVQLGYIKATEI